MWSHANRLRYLTLTLALLIAVHSVHVNAKRISSGGSRRSSSSSSSSARRTTSNTHSYTPSSSSHTGSHTAHSPSYSHSDLSKLSYSGYNAQPNRQSALGSSSSHGQGARPTSAPIGWNVPKQQGPPPAYSASNPAGGAKTNLHESPPAYRPNSAPPPSYSAATHTGSTHGVGSGTNSGSHYTPIAATNVRGSQAGYNRNRMNSTFGGGSHTPIAATHAGGLQSGYPGQHASAPTYYPAGSHLPAGASYHPAGSVPHGASYYPSASHLPAGASYHAPGALPAGATYYPAGAAPGGHGYYPAVAAVPVGATFVPAGGALPAGATYFAQPPRQSSSGLGFGSGLAAGALGGALLGHALTPTHTRVIDHGAGSYGGGGGGSNGNNDDKIIIINNGPPGSVSTTNAGPGTTVINTGAAAGPAQDPQFAPTYNQPGPGPAPAPPALAPFGTPAAEHPNVAGTVPSVLASPAATPITSSPVAAPGPVDTVGASTGAVVPPSGAAAGSAEQPAAGGIICVPVRVNEPDPADSTKTVEVEKIACYPAPPPEPTAAVASVAAVNNAAPVSSGETAAPGQVATTSGTSDAPLAALSSEQSAPLVPINVPEGWVALAPIYPNKQPDLMKLPGGDTIVKREASNEMFSASSAQYTKSLAPSVNRSINLAVSVVMALIAFYLH